MKCVKIVGPRKLERAEMEYPEKKDKRVIIDVVKAGICGSDIHNFESGEPVGLVMGHEFAGVVVDPGSRDDLKVGDHVTALPISPCRKCFACKSGNPQYCAHTWEDALGLALTNPGAYSERISVDASLVLKMPESVSFEEGAMVEPTAVGLHAIHLADIKVGDKVLVIGGGIIGLVSAMFAKMEGASYVVISETNKERGKKAVDLKVADEYLDATDDFVNKCFSKTGDGFDIVIDCCGNDPAVTSAIMVTRAGGTIVLVGVSTKPITIPTVVSVLHEQTIKGAIAYTEEEFKTCLALIANKRIDVLKFVDKIVSLDEVQDAFEELTSGISPSVKILIDPKK